MFSSESRQKPTYFLFCFLPLPLFGASLAQEHKKGREECQVALNVLWRVLGSVGVSTVDMSLSRQEMVREKSEGKAFGMLMEKTVVFFVPVGLRGQANPSHAVCVPTGLPLLGPMVVW